MIRKITLHNFMSHRHTIIEPAEGLTVLAGENNCGKSAVVAALQVLCNNAMGDYMVRHGESDCRIIVETDEGNVVEWRRENGTVSYTLNGQPLYRLRGEVPDDLHKLLRLPPVTPQDGGAPFDIHFGEQKKPVFLLDEPGSRAAKFFASSSDAESLIRMQQLHTRNVRDASSRSRQLQDQLSALDKRLEPLGRVENVQNRLDGLEKDYEQLLILRAIAGNLTRDIETLSASTTEVGALQVKAHALGELKAPPHLSDAGPLSQLAEKLSASLSEVNFLQVEMNALALVGAPPRLRDTAPLSDVSEKLSSSLSEVNTLRLKASALGALVAPPLLTNTAPLNELSGQLSSSLRHSCRCEWTKHALDRLETPPKMADTLALEELSDAIASTNRAADRLFEIQTALSELTAAPIAVPTEGLKSVCDEMEGWLLRAEYQDKRVRCTMQLQTPPTLLDIGPLADRIVEIGETLLALRLAQDVINQLEACAAPPALRDEQPLQGCADELSRRLSEVAECESVCAILAALGSPPQRIDLAPLAALISEIGAAQQSLDTLSGRLHEAEVAAGEAEEAIRNWVAENRVCPTCGAELDPDRMVAMAASAAGEHLHG